MPGGDRGRDFRLNLGRDCDGQRFVLREPLGEPGHLGQLLVEALDQGVGVGRERRHSAVSQLLGERLNAGDRRLERIERTL